MIDNLSTLIFLIGLLILILPYVIIARLKKTMSYDKQIKMMMVVLVAIVFIVAAWVLREKREKYDYNYAIQSGKIVAGTVYASYPENAPGLGWIN